MRVLLSNRTGRIPVLTLLLLPLGAETALAQESDNRRGADRGMETQGAVEAFEEPGGVTVSFQLAYYGHDDSPGDGNPFLDEDLTVIEPILIYDQTLTDTFGYSATITYDRVTSASIDRLGEFAGQSGASGDNYIGLDLAFRHKRSDELRLGWHVGASTEYDYNSIGLGGTATWEPKGGDRVLTLGLNGYLDSIDIIRFDGSDDEGSESRGSLTLNASWWQLLSPTMWGELGVTVARQEGFLSTPYNGVVILDPGGATQFDDGSFGREVTEVLPGDRMRYALNGRIRKRVRPGTALELAGRIYNDDWGINSFTVEPAVYQTLVKDKLDLMVRYRYYTQSEADYFDLDINETDPLKGGFRTQDSDLGEFDANTLGARLVWFRSASQTLNIGLDIASRSDGLDYIYASIGWSIAF